MALLQASFRDVWLNFSQFLGTELLVMKRCSKEAQRIASNELLWRNVHVSFIPSPIDLRLPLDGFAHCNSSTAHFGQYGMSKSQSCRYTFCASFLQNDLSAVGWFAVAGQITFRTLRNNGCKFLRQMTYDVQTHAFAFPALKWLADAYGLTRDDFTTHRSQIFRIACQTGKLEFAKWLVERFQLKLPRFNQQVQKARVYGHSEIAEWLIANRDILKEPAFEKRR